MEVKSRKNLLRKLLSERDREIPEIDLLGALLLKGVSQSKVMRKGISNIGQNYR